MVYMLIICVIFVLLCLLKIYIKLTTGWCTSQVCLKGKTVIITGANSGIGFETALDLAKRGARLILACRNEQSAIEAREKIVKITNNDDVIYKIIDFCSLRSIRQFAQDIIATESHLDILINNAGAGGLADKVTEDGFPATMQTNYIGPFLLTNLLLSLLMKSSSSRVINVSSMVAKYASLDINNITKFEGDMDQYLRSKLCLNLFTVELASRLKSSNVTVYSLHPGMIRTEIFRRMPNLMRRVVNFWLEVLCKSAREGAQTTIHLAVSKDIERFNGEHFHDCHLVPRYPTCISIDLAKQLWEKTEELLRRSDVKIPS